MGSGTAGAVLDAISRMRRAERELARHRVARPRFRDLRAVPRRDGGAPDRLPFACFFLCNACGRLEEGSSANPMRRDGADGDAPGACPACNAKAWIDLRSESLALAYRESELMDSRRHDEEGWHFSLWIGAATSTAVTSALVLWTTAFGDLAGMMRGMVMLVFIVTWLATSVVLRRLTRRSLPVQARPRRWRHPLLHQGGPRRRSVWGAATGDASLRAPLSQTPCLGWSLQVWNDDGPLLDEQLHVELLVEGEAFEPDSVRLELEARELQPRDGDEAFARFLQCRGLTPHDPSLRVREACLVPGTVVEVKPFDPVKGGLVLGASTRALAA
jgi:hypothetical protein